MATCGATDLGIVSEIANIGRSVGLEDGIAVMAATAGTPDSCLEELVYSARADSGYALKKRKGRPEPAL